MVGSGFIMANVLFNFGASDGTLALVDGVLLPPPAASDVLQSYNISIFPKGAGLSDYALATDDLYYYTL